MEREKLVDIWLVFRIWESEACYGEFVCVTSNLCVGMVGIFNLQLGLSLIEQVTRANNGKTVSYEGVLISP
jgi:hypothetical protein